MKRTENQSFNAVFAEDFELPVSETLELIKAHDKCWKTDKRRLFKRNRVSEKADKIGNISIEFFMRWERGTDNGIGISPL